MGKIRNCYTGAAPAEVIVRGPGLRGTSSLTLQQRGCRPGIDATRSLQRDSLATMTLPSTRRGNDEK